MENHVSRRDVLSRGAFALTAVGAGALVGDKLRGQSSSSSVPACYAPGSIKINGRSYPLSAEDTGIVPLLSVLGPHLSDLVAGAKSGNIDGITCGCVTSSIETLFTHANCAGWLDQVCPPMQAFLSNTANRPAIQLNSTLIQNVKTTLGNFGFTADFWDAVSDSSFIAAVNGAYPWGTLETLTKANIVGAETDLLTSVQSAASLRTDGTQGASCGDYMAFAAVLVGVGAFFAAFGGPIGVIVGAGFVGAGLGLGVGAWVYVC